MNHNLQNNNHESEHIAESMVPYFPDDEKKSRYLSFRVAGFTVREATSMVGIHDRTVKRWREADPAFAAIDLTGLSTLKKQLGSEYLNIEFTRNFRMVLEKDFRVLAKSLNGNALTKEEDAYLLKLRGFYTPQQLAVIQQLIGESSAEGFDFTKMVLEIRREKEEITLTQER